jgi:hypothetical protein
MKKPLQTIAYFTLLILFFILLQNRAYSQCTQPTTTDASRCGEGSVTLTVSGNTGIYYWYDDATGGTFYGNTSSFTTPVLTRTDTFYAAEINTGTTNDALSFDGTDDYVAIQDLYFSDPGEIPVLTVEAWVRTTVNSGNWYSN